MKPVHRKETTYINLITRTATACLQWLPEFIDDPAIHHDNHLQVHICGEDAFRSIAKDIAGATKSIDLICWGFDPAMELERTGHAWPRGTTYGDLLADAAENRGVRVRLLCWYDAIGSSSAWVGAKNMPGYSNDTHAALRFDKALPRSKQYVYSGRGPGATTPQVDQFRTDYNANWYGRVFGGHEHIAIRTRSGNKEAVTRSMDAAGQAARLGVIEEAVLANGATHHQKTILIDYEGEHPVGYVMGLNSVTDYWDTREHRFNDSRRGANWEGQGEGHATLKPYQDYVCRVQGAALMELSKNFESAWRRAKEPPGHHSIHAAPPTAPAPHEDITTARLAKTVKGLVNHRAQIVRTQPEEDETTIERSYRLASGNARRYLYVENQYLQYTPWATQLKAYRASWVQGWQEAGRSPADMPTLHVMVVIPTPEKSQMIPRTHDTVKALGLGESIPNQDRAIEDELKRHREQQRICDDYQRRASAPGAFPLMLGAPPLLPQPLSKLASDSQALGEKETIAKELKTLGMRTLVGSLWTYDEDWRSTQEKELDQLNEWKDQPAQAERYEALNDKLRAARYREIYIHSKLMMIDDSFFTLGSANLNLRSMAVDSELNIATDDRKLATDLRRRVWGMHTGGELDGGDGSAPVVEETFKRWTKLMTDNRDAKTLGKPLKGFLLPFLEKRTSTIRLG